MKACDMFDSYIEYRFFIEGEPNEYPDFVEEIETYYSYTLSQNAPYLTTQRI